jgi:hypothetical protein
VDNEKGYKAGNLRWATRRQQANNKRGYHGHVYGRRLANLEKMRPDVTYECLRTWVLEGMSDEQIMLHKKGSHRHARK